MNLKRLETTAVLLLSMKNIDVLFHLKFLVVMKRTRPLCRLVSMSQNDFQTSETMQPQEARPMKFPMSILGTDIAKRVFPVVGIDEWGQIVLRKRLSRHDLMPFIATLPPVLIGMEACGGAHDWARRFREHGHEVKLMPPQFVKPYGATCKLLLWLFRPCTSWLRIIVSAPTPE